MIQRRSIFRRLCFISLIFFSEQGMTQDHCETLFSKLFSNVKRLVFEEKLGAIPIQLVASDSQYLAVNAMKRGVVPGNVAEGLFIISKKSAKDPMYIENSKVAYSYFLAQMDLFEQPLSVDKFFEIHSKLHYLILKGPNGGRSFVHKGSEKRIFDTVKVDPGLLRKLTINTKGTDDFIYTFSANDPRAAEGIKRFEELTFGASPFKDFSKPIIIPEIPEKGLPKIRYVQQSFSVFDKTSFQKVIHITYPRPKYLPYYIKQMGHHLSIIFKELKSQRPNEEIIIQHLAYYVQLGAISHLYKRVNMSLTLLEANAILNQIGHPGIYHTVNA